MELATELLKVKLEIQGEMWTIVGRYAPPIWCGPEEKAESWEQMDNVMQTIPSGGRLVVAGDRNK